MYKFNLVYNEFSLPKSVGRAVQELQQENVAAIIGPLLKVNEAGLAAQELQIPLIALTQKSDFPLQGDYLFSNFITPEMQVKTLGSYLFNELNIKNSNITDSIRYASRIQNAL